MTQTLRTVATRLQRPQEPHGGSRRTPSAPPAAGVLTQVGIGDAGKEKQLKDKGPGLGSGLALTPRWDSWNVSSPQEPQFPHPSNGLGHLREPFYPGNP